MHQVRRLAAAHPDTKAGPIQGRPGIMPAYIRFRFPDYIVYTVYHHRHVLLRSRTLPLLHAFPPSPTTSTLHTFPPPHPGYSPFPGNINQLVLKLDSYVVQLGKTGGIISEFVNPKYK